MERNVHLEQRALGMALADPELARAHPDLHLYMTIEEHRAAWRALAEGKGDLVALAERFGEDFGAYLAGLAVNDSFCPQNFPAYVRVLKALHDERAFAARLERLRPKRRSDDPFRGRGL